MKKQILFVDDEPNILRALQRSLRPLRAEWDMVFSEGAQTALELLDKQRFDVIVTDMRMPEIDGAQLLNRVQKTHPTMVRIILSGHSDQEMILKTVKSAHQYLAKPCEKNVLVSAITRSCAVQDILSKKKLQQLLGGIETLPSPPSLYTQILAETRSAEASVASVADIISKDMGMTAKVLQLVNSAFFALPRHISTARDAVALLGIDVVKNLILGIEVFSRVSQTAMSVLPMDQVNDHCVRTGAIAQAIARLEKMDTKKTDNALIAGILHDLGKLLLVDHFPGDYKKVLALVEAESIPVFEAEHHIFGVTHAEVGAYLLGLWGFSGPIIEAVAFHHHPADIVSETFELCGLIHVAELMEHRKSGGERKLSGLDEIYMEKFGLMERLSLWQDDLKRKPDENSH